MNQATTDLFGEKRVSIGGNTPLERIANQILELVGRNPDLLNGDKVGEIDSKLTLAIWYDSGLGQFIPEDRREAFAQWFSNPKQCADYELISRARRWLLEHDHIRISATAIQDAERHRVRIAQSVKA